MPEHRGAGVQMWPPEVHTEWPRVVAVRPARLSSSSGRCLQCWSSSRALAGTVPAAFSHQHSWNVYIGLGTWVLPCNTWKCSFAPLFTLLLLPSRPPQD